MTDEHMHHHAEPEHDVAPGELHEGDDTILHSILSYLLGLVLSVVLTIASFWAARTQLIYAPGIPITLATLAVAQMGIHLVFFLHLTTAPDNKNNILALAFGLFIVCLVVFGSLWIMTHLSHNLMPMNELMKMQP